MRQQITEQTKIVRCIEHGSFLPAQFETLGAVWSFLQRFAVRSQSADQNHLVALFNQEQTDLVHTVVSVKIICNRNDRSRFTGHGSKVGKRRERDLFRFRSCLKDHCNLFESILDVFHFRENNAQSVVLFT